MEILVNNEHCELPASGFLEEALIHLKMESRKGIAVSVNQQIIPRIKWKETILNEGDKIVIIEASQGG
jgi:sulfur carrier protein